MNARADIAVVGAGAAGLAAALASARAGCATVLLDNRPSPGGTGGHSGLNTLCGLYDDGGHFLNPGIPQEFADALAEAVPVKMGRVFVLPYRPAKFREVAEKLLGAETKLQTSWNTALHDVELDGNRIVRVNGSDVRAVIDCSGTAEVARRLGLACSETDDTTQAPAVIIPLRHVERDLAGVAAVAQVLLPLARAGFPPLALQPDLDPGSVTIKFTGPPAAVESLIHFLKTSVPGFETCSCPVPFSEIKSTPRAGRMIPGRQMLTGADVLAARQFPDAVARGAWPIEQWSAKGIARFRYLPEGTHYNIPAGCLQASAVTNLFMAGKTISADAAAMASARVMGCCLATGAAAGFLAAKSLQSYPET